jgi:DNA-binding MarR family transcriptional regulator
MQPVSAPPQPRPAQDVDEAEPFALESFLPYRLSVLINTMSRAFARLYGERFGLSIPEWRVMAVLGRFAPLSANEVAERTAMDKVRVSRAVARLSKAGLVGRATDAEDRRRSALRLSKTGRRMHDSIVPMARAIEAGLLEGLSPADRDALDRLVTTLMERARRLDADPQGSVAPALNRDRNDV